MGHGVGGRPFSLEDRGWPCRVGQAERGHGENLVGCRSDRERALGRGNSKDRAEH